MMVAMTTEMAAMIAHSRADAPRSRRSGERTARTRARSSSQRMPTKYSIASLFPGPGDRSPRSLCHSHGFSLTRQLRHRRVGEEHEKPEADDQLGDQHRLRLLARLALDVGHLPAA